MMKISFGLSLLLWLNQTAYPQIDSTEVSKKINHTRLAIVGATTLVSLGAVQIAQQNAWWSGQRQPFHVVNDWGYALSMDKLGHIYGQNLISNMFAGSLEWANLEREQALFYGAGLGTLFGLFVEFQDGFATDWGFSPGDAMANVVGAWYPVLQYHVPMFQSFNFKWSYIPTTQLSNGTKKIFIDDYEGQTMWLSVRIQDFLPTSLRKVYPKFLNLALGYGVRNLDGNGGGDRELYISLDYDFESLPGESAFLKSLKRILNYIHFPAPAVRLTPTVAFFGLFYSKNL